MRDGLGRARRRGWSGVNVWGGELGKIWGGRQEHRDTNQPPGGTGPVGGGPRLPPAVVGAHLSLRVPSTTPFFSCHRPLGHSGDTFPCPTCQHPRSPCEGPRGAPRARGHPARGATSALPRASSGTWVAWGGCSGDGARDPRGSGGKRGGGDLERGEPSPEVELCVVTLSGLGTSVASWVGAECPGVGAGASSLC